MTLMAHLRYTNVWDCSPWGIQCCLEGTIPAFDSLTIVNLHSEGATDLIYDNRVVQKGS